MVIGEKYDVKEIIEKDKSYLQFDAPNRTLFASFLILQGKFSWLNEGKGKCIIICRKTNERSKRISIFDMPFLHKIVIKKFNLGRKLRELEFPLFFHPIEVLNYLYKSKYKESVIDECPINDIVEFCVQRDIELEYRVINK